MLDGSTVVRRGPRSAYRELAEGAGAVVLHLETAAYHGLNEMGNLIWMLIADGITFDALVANVRERVEDPPASMEEEVSDFLQQLEKRGVVILTPPATERS